MSRNIILYSYFTRHGFCSLYFLKSQSNLAKGKLGKCQVALGNIRLLGLVIAFTIEDGRIGREARLRIPKNRNIYEIPL